MSDGNPPRRPANRPNPATGGGDHEVAGDNAQRQPVRARPVQAKPVPGGTPPATTAQPAVAKPAQPAAAKPGVVKAVVAKPATPAVGDTQVGRKSTTEVPKVPAKPKVVAAAADDDEDEDDRPRKKRDDDSPAKKKVRFSEKERKRIRSEKRAEETKERNEMMQEWVVPGIMMGFGTLLMVVAAFVHSTSSAHAAVGAGMMIVASFVYAAVMIPVVIVLLIIVGKIFGIEYGSLGHAVRSLGAVLMLLVGIYWTGSLFGIMGMFVAPAIASLVTYVLFLNFFELDADEARTTTGVMNFITWIGNFLLQTLVISQMILSQQGGDRGSEPDDGDIEDSSGMVAPTPGTSPTPRDEPGRGNRRPPQPSDDEDE